MDTTQNKRGPGQILKTIFGKKWVRVILVLLILAGIACAALPKVMTSRSNAQESQTVRTATVERRTIESSMTGSSTLEALDTYEVTATVTGDVIEANFEEGDTVQEGDVLYRIDTDDADEQIESAQTNLERMQDRYNTALKDYNKAAEKYASLDYASEETGYIKTLYVEAGDTIQAGTKIADIYNDRTMVLEVPFLSGYADQIEEGMEAQVTISETNETLAGVVSDVSSMEQTMSGGSIVRMVSIEVENPGGLSTANTASASVNGMKCSGDGSFSPILEKELTADLSAEIASVTVKEGSFVNAGDTLFTLDNESVEEQLQNSKDALETAEENLEDAQTQLKNQEERLDDYEITAPISGQIISKLSKVGDTLGTSNSSSTNTMALIYDMSALTFEMSVDEMDILDVKAGQEVEVTADALEGQTFTGIVTNVSLSSSYSNGVTNYPVTVRIDEIGDLLPGMNVTGKIIIEQSENTLAIPAEALMRGNQVYVQDDSVTESVDGVPAGFRAVEVETGLISTDYVEILSGLEEGDVVYIDPTKSTGSSSQMGGMMMPGGGGMPSGGGMPTGGGAMGGGGRPGGGF